jgi:tRNA nucleotidyltransferase (CCA-adding enzyme)
MDELIKIGEMFAPNSVYVVGGSVRNELLKLLGNDMGETKRDGDIRQGYMSERGLCGATTISGRLNFKPNGTDIDLCGAMTPEDVMGIGERFGVRVAPINPRIGTLKLSLNGCEFEYTTFRRDNYDISGEHRPTSVVFTRDIEEDAKRRDFTVNAIYYDIGSGRIIDSLNGISDLKNRVLRACNEPRVTLSEDGLRLMRLVRFAAEYGFRIEEETFFAAKNYAALISKISGERIREELLKILASDRFLDENNDGEKEGIGPEYGLRLLADLGILKYIIPELDDCVGFALPRKYRKYDLFTHIVKTVAYAPKNLRLAALFHDTGKPLCFALNGNTRAHARYGAEIAKKRMGRNGMKFKTADVKCVAELVGLHMFDADGKTEESKVRLFVQENSEIMDDLIELKKADHRAKGLGGECAAALRAEKIFGAMKKEGAPFFVSDLKINGDDLKELGAESREIGGILENILKACANDKGMLEKDRQLETAAAMIKSGGK